MITKMKFIAPFLMAGAAATAIGVAPIAIAESFSGTAASSYTIPATPGGDACTPDGVCGNGGPDGGTGCTTDGTCGGGGPQGGSGCTADGVCGGGGPQGGGGCVPGVGCFHWP